ncbi:hypothetical protein [Aureispira anguillae]|uniref:Uncharacterized protein n=1 Tax=Aureispira anguillae TaxID=2864201 RepID=A0A915YAQ5_9BACT|nr:hypothetical protein [Aureispira anguillae]BDS09391.1 hypothetical protein AsAng_0000890 [Aureispira anguillae]
MKLTRKSGLFELVNRLTTSEKRYIKQFINRAGESNSNYAKLFNLIIKTEICDDEELKKKFKKIAIVKQWSRTKNYLYNYILRVLQVYNQQNVEFEILNNLQQVDILYKKGLDGDAYQLLKKTKKLAFEGIYPTLLPFIAEWEMRLGRLIWNYQEEKEPLNYQKNNEWALDVANNLLLLEKYRTDVLINMVAKGRHLRVKEINQEILAKAVFKSIDEAKSPFSKWAFCVTKNIIYAQVWQFFDVYSSAKDGIELHRQFPLLKKQAPRTYIASINNFIAAAIEIGKWDEALMIMEEIDLYVEKNNDEINNVLLMSIKYLAFLKLKIESRDYEGWEEYGEEIETFIKKHKKENNTYVRPDYILQYYTVICIVNGEFVKALELIEDIEQIQKIAIYRNAVLLMKLICLFELNEVLQLPYVIRSIYRNLRKKKDLFDFERIILNLFKASANVASKNELKNVFRRYLVQLKKLAQTAPKAELELLEHFDFLAWMESKVEDRPLLEILKEHSMPSIKKTNGASQ